MELRIGWSQWWFFGWWLTDESADEHPAQPVQLCSAHQGAVAARSMTSGRGNSAVFKVSP